MPPVITPGFSFTSGEKVTPGKLHDLVDTCTAGDIPRSEISLGDVTEPSYGTDRPTCAPPRIHYDTTPGLEGLYFAWSSGSNASVCGWLCAMPRRECYCWAASAASAYTPVYPRIPHDAAGDYRYGIKDYDGTIFPFVWPHPGGSGPHDNVFLTLESVDADKPVKCMWAGLVPDSVALLGLSGSGASLGDYLYSSRASSAQWGIGPTSAFPATPRVWGIATRDSSDGGGLLLWSGISICGDD